MKTYMAKKDETDRKWYMIDAEGMVLGKLAVKAADILRGKTKPTFTPHVDTGDFVVVINAEKVQLTGRKLEGKVYYHHTGYIGGIRAETAKHRMERKPELVIEAAVKGMLPKNSLGRSIFKKLKVYPGSAHPHGAQSPESVN